MFKIDQTSNRITRLESKRFSELGFSERNHLQEWLAHQPDAFGEELLIIQKEFDGFDDTRERLDLLALDKDGNLVIIENKLDDTGRDVVWQALKYASYCSSLNKKQIVDIYQGYLNRFCQGGDANQGICEFLEVPDIDEVVLNSGNSQRLIFVAANFRKEVTSTALWLLGHGLQLQCLRATPYIDDTTVFLSLEQIVPPPETKELMISMSEKEREDKVTVKKTKAKYGQRKTFWSSLINDLTNSDTSLFNNVSPRTDNYLITSSGVPGISYTLTIRKDEIQVAIEFNSKNELLNSERFESLYSLREGIEKQFGEPLIWLAKNGSTLAKVIFKTPYTFADENEWPMMAEWFVVTLIRFESSLKQPLVDVNKLLKNKSNETT